MFKSTSNLMNLFYYLRDLYDVIVERLKERLKESYSVNKDNYTCEFIGNVSSDDTWVFYSNFNL